MIKSTVKINEIIIKIFNNNFLNNEILKKVNQFLLFGSNDSNIILSFEIDNDNIDLSIIKNAQSYFPINTKYALKLNQNKLDEKLISFAMENDLHIQWILKDINNFTKENIDKIRKYTGYGYSLNLIFNEKLNNIEEIVEKIRNDCPEMYTEMDLLQLEDKYQFDIDYVNRLIGSIFVSDFRPSLELSLFKKYIQIYLDYLNDYNSRTFKRRINNLYVKNDDILLIDADGYLYDDKDNKLSDYNILNDDNFDYIDIFNNATNYIDYKPTINETIIYNSIIENFNNFIDYKIEKVDL